MILFALLAAQQSSWQLFVITASLQLHGSSACLYTGLLFMTESMQHLVMEPDL
jgi:hypothetical protein